jgi:hypothetical protein
MNEVEAYSWELDHARDNALTDGEIATITRRRQTHYDRLSDDNQDRADEHNYTPI